MEISRRDWQDPAAFRDVAVRGWKKKPAKMSIPVPPRNDLILTPSNLKIKMSSIGI